VIAAARKWGGFNVSNSKFATQLGICIKYAGFNPTVNWKVVTRGTEVLTDRHDVHADPGKICKYATNLIIIFTHADNDA
jgi:hypothetical protein